VLVAAGIYLVNRPARSAALPQAKEAKADAA
jgi:hypothetical protein